MESLTNLEKMPLQSNKPIPTIHETNGSWPHDKSDLNIQKGSFVNRGVGVETLEKQLPPKPQQYVVFSNFTTPDHYGDELKVIEHHFHRL